MVMSVLIDRSVSDNVWPGGEVDLPHLSGALMGHEGTRTLPGYDVYPVWGLVEESKTCSSSGCAATSEPVCSPRDVDHSPKYHVMPT